MERSRNHSEATFTSQAEARDTFRIIETKQALGETRLIADATQIVALCRHLKTTRSSCG